MFKKFYYQIISRFPSKNGQKAANELIDVLNRGGIQFEISKHDDESGKYFMAKSVNLPGKHIITAGKTLAELDANIRDAIFSGFQVPIYYCNHISINVPVLSEKINLQYAAA
ncbi:MAG: hypothetical protein ABIC82_05655 [bacterium]